MQSESYPTMFGCTDLDADQLDQLHGEIVEEAFSIHRSLEESGGWRSPQDCWIEARTAVLSRRRV